MLIQSELHPPLSSGLFNLECTRKTFKGPMNPSNRSSLPPPGQPILIRREGEKKKKYFFWGGPDRLSIRSILRRPCDPWRPRTNKAIFIDEFQVRRRLLRWLLRDVRFRSRKFRRAGAARGFGPTVDPVRTHGRRRGGRQHRRSRREGRHGRPGGGPHATVDGRTVNGLAGRRW